MVQQAICVNRRLNGLQSNTLTTKPWGIVKEDGIDPEFGVCKIGNFWELITRFG